MKNLIIILFFFASIISFGQEKFDIKHKRVISKIDSTRSPELVLIQEFKIKSPIDSIWDAYTTKKGYERWAAPLAEVNLKVGGFIKSNYNPQGKIGDSTTIVTHIINYVPKTLITLQAEITDNFPEFMKKEAKDFYNVIYFEELDNGYTSVRSFGIGYKNNPKYLSLMNYFIPANEKLLLKLITLLEQD